MDNLFDDFMEVICDEFCKCRGNECGEDTPCFLEIALVNRLRKFCEENE